MAPRCSSMRMSGAEAQLGAVSAACTSGGACPSRMGAWACRRNSSRRWHRCLARASSWPPRPRAEDNRPESVTSDRRRGADGSCSWLLSCVHPSLLVDSIVVAYAAALKGGKTVRITECRPRSCLQGRFHRSISKLRPVDIHLLGRAIAGPGALAADDEYR